MIHISLVDFSGSLLYQILFRNEYIDPDNNMNVVMQHVTFNTTFHRIWYITLCPVFLEKWGITGIFQKFKDFLKKGVDISLIRYYIALQQNKIFTFVGDKPCKPNS